MSIVTRFVQLLQKWGNVGRENRRDVLSLCEPNPEAKLLDLGCGNGEFTLKVAERIGTGNVFGIDIVKDNVEQAKAKGIDCYQADLDGAKLPFEDESFDAVCANHIIEHVSDTDGFVKEVHRVLKPGGYAVISTPNLAAWHCIVFLLLGWQPHPAQVSDEDVAIGMRFYGATDTPSRKTGYPNHRRIFTFRTLKEFVEYHGLKVQKSMGSGMFPLPSPLARLTCTLDKRHATIVSVKACKNYSKGAGT